METRENLTELHEEISKINSIRFNVKKKELNNKLNKILKQKREINELRIRGTYQAISNDPHHYFIKQF